MANKEWDNASINEKMLLLRHDLGEISKQHNILSQDFVNLQKRVEEIEKKLF